MPDLKIKTLDQRRRLLLWPVWLVVRLWGRTLRFHISPEDRAQITDISRPALLLIWHNRLFLAAEIYQRYRRPRPTYALVSASNDGAWMAAVLQLAGVRAVRGSSSRRGRESVADLATRLTEGHDVALTPDGPRGPIYSFKPGAAILARRTEARVLLIGSRFTGVWRLKSWDRFAVPWPFSKIEISCRTIAPGNLPSDFAECGAFLQRELTELSPD